MHQMHPLSSYSCHAAAAAILAASLFAAVQPVDVPAAIGVNDVAVQTGATASTTNTTTTNTTTTTTIGRHSDAVDLDECPDYAKALRDSRVHRVLVVVSYVGCPYCTALENDLRNNGIPFASVVREKHPVTFSSFGATLFPSWYVLRNGRIVASGTGQSPAAFFQQILEAD